MFVLCVVILFIIIVVVILGLIIVGVIMFIEVVVVGVFGVLVLVLVYCKFFWELMCDVLICIFKFIGMIMWILFVVYVFSVVY